MAASVAAIPKDGLTSIIVVAADSGPLLCESAARALEATSRVELIVVDNASADGEPERVLAAHAGDTRVRLVRNARNLGFGPACNRGAALARGDAFVFLNPDCLLEPGAIAALRAIASADARIGVLGVEVLAPGGGPARGNRRRDPTLRRAFMTLSGLARFAARQPAFAGVEMPASSPATAVAEPVDAVSGACLFVPRFAFDAVGGFDERYFLHVEDLDLCRRVRDAGYSVAIAPAVKATHAQGSSSAHRPVFVDWHKHRGMWRYFRRFDPAARNPFVRGLAWLGLWAHFAAMLPIRMLGGMARRTPFARD